METGGVDCIAIGINLSTSVAVVRMRSVKATEVKRIQFCKSKKMMARPSTTGWAIFSETGGVAAVVDGTTHEATTVSTSRRLVAIVADQVHYF